MQKLQAARLFIINVPVTRHMPGNGCDDIRVANDIKCHVYNITHWREGADEGTGRRLAHKPDRSKAAL